MRLTQLTLPLQCAVEGENCWARLISSLLVQMGGWRPEGERDSSKDRSPQASWVSS